MRVVSSLPPMLTNLARLAARRCMIFAEACIKNVISLSGGAGSPDGGRGGDGGATVGGALGAPQRRPWGPGPLPVLEVKGCP